MNLKRNVNYIFKFDREPFSFMKTFKSGVVTKIDKMHVIENESQSYIWVWYMTILLENLDEMISGHRKT